MIKREYLKTTSLDAETVKELLPMFFAEIDLEFKKLLESFELKDFIQIKTIAHKINGTAKSFGAYRIEQNSEEIMMHIEQKQSSSLITTIKALGIHIKQLKLAYEE